MRPGVRAVGANRTNGPAATPVRLVARVRPEAGDHRGVEQAQRSDDQEGDLQGAGHGGAVPARSMCETPLLAGLASGLSDVVAHDLARLR